ncbi:MAG: hypothetical protein AB8B65_04015 [Kordia sp.]|uniref:hypothetical protein n=1 Tax=Kordia sp. TaxID=1965332 RepID=UPI00385D46F1
MKRTTFTTLGVAAMTLIACNTSTKEVKTEKAAVPQKVENVAQETTTQFEEKAMEDCIAYSKIQNEIKLMEAMEAARVTDSIANAELALQETLAKAVAAQKKRESTPEALAKRAVEAELWFKANYESVVKAYKSNYDGLRVRLTTEGDVYEAALLINGEWKVDMKLMEKLEKVEVTKDLAPGKAVDITVKNA